MKLSDEEQSQLKDQMNKIINKKTAEYNEELTEYLATHNMSEMKATTTEKFIIEKMATLAVAVEHTVVITKHEMKMILNDFIDKINNAGKVDENTNT